MDNKDLKATVNTIPVKNADPKEDILKAAAKEVAKVDSTKKVTVEAIKLNIRKNASETSPVMGVVSKGDVITVSTTPAGDWYKVTEPKEGYVKKNLVKE